MSNYISVDPTGMERRKIYRLLTGFIVLRPIGWRSKINDEGIANLTPFITYIIVCAAHPMILLGIL